MSRYELYSMDQLLELVRNGRADVSAKAASEIRARFAQLKSRPTPVAADGAAPCAKCGTRSVLWKCRVCGHDNRPAAKP